MIDAPRSAWRSTVDERDGRGAQGLNASRSVSGVIRYAATPVEMSIITTGRTCFTCLPKQLSRHKAVLPVRSAPGHLAPVKRRLATNARRRFGAFGTSWETAKRSELGATTPRWCLRLVLTVIQRPADCVREFAGDLACGQPVAAAGLHN